MKRIYLSPPHMGPDERELLIAAFDSNWVAPLGPHVDGFEEEIAAHVGVSHAAALSSGTAAIHLALIILGVQRGDEVWTSSLTFAATANPICYLGATPVFIDCERQSWTMDPGLLDEELDAANKRGCLPKAVIVVDLYGQCADYDRLVASCARYGVPLIEDAAEALGASYRGRQAGSLGTMGILSFNGNKIITTSGGGMLLANERAWIERARFLATQSRDPAPHYQHSHLGYNYRLSNLLAALGRGQLRHLQERVATRRALNAYYRRALGDLPGLSFLPEAEWGTPNCWLTCIQIDPELFGADREALRLRLEAEQIEARPVWKPMHQQPIFQHARCIGGAVADELFARGLCLPSGSNLESHERERIVELIRSACPAAR